MDVSDRGETGENDNFFYRQIFIHRKIFAILNIFMSYGGEAGRLMGSSCSGRGSIYRVISLEPKSSVGDVVSLRSEYGNMCNIRNVATAYRH